MHVPGCDSCWCPRHNSNEWCNSCNVGTWTPQYSAHLRFARWCQAQSRAFCAPFWTLCPLNVRKLRQFLTEVFISLATLTLRTAHALHFHPRRTLITTTLRLRRLHQGGTDLCPPPMVQMGRQLVSIRVGHDVLDGGLARNLRRFTRRRGAMERIKPEIPAAQALRQAPPGTQVVGALCLPLIKLDAQRYAQQIVPLAGRLVLKALKTG